MLRSHASHALLAASLTTLAGCYSMHPHGMQPGMYAPGAPVYPQAVPRASYVVPGEVIRSPGPVQTAPPSIPSAGSRLEAPSPRSSQSPASEQPVPQPRDPDAESRALDSGIRTSDAGAATSSIDVDDNRFYKPRVVEPRALADTSSAQPLTDESGVTQVNFESYVSRDAEFRWLQGPLEYDARDRTWHLMYDLSPPVTDQLGGEVTLSGNLPFRTSDRNQIFRVHGTLDGRDLDPRLKKPKYRVTKVERVVPRTHQ